MYYEKRQKKFTLLYGKHLRLPLVKLGTSRERRYFYNYLVKKNLKALKKVFVFLLFLKLNRGQGGWDRLDRGGGIV
jgi:hypothetical protein